MRHPNLSTHGLSQSKYIQHHQAQRRHSHDRDISSHSYLSHHPRHTPRPQKRKRAETRLHSRSPRKFSRQSVQPKPEPNTHHATAPNQVDRCKPSQPARKPRLLDCFRRPNEEKRRRNEHRSETTTAATALPARAVGRGGGDVLDAADLHARAGEGAERGLGAGAGGLGAVT